MEQEKKTLKKAIVQKSKCVACGTCVRECPRGAITVENGVYAKIDENKCIGCGKCKMVCPASAIKVGEELPKKQTQWYDYLWIATLTYLILGLFNILFAWLGLICFFLPIIMSIVIGNKTYCHKYCGRSKLFSLIGDKLKLSSKQEMPKFLSSNWFRYGFLIFFMTMFANMIFTTILVFTEAKTLSEIITLFWTFKLFWGFAYSGETLQWISQFAFGFYSIMLTSTLIGIIMMLFFKPRSWCVICPMGTMTQLICKAKNRKEQKN